MSSLKLKHSGGNSVSIAAPSSNPASNRTLTVPSNADGTILTTTNPKSGNILQVVSSVKNDTASANVSADTYSDLGITDFDVDITPASTSNKILISGFVNVSRDGAGGFVYIQLRKGGSAITGATGDAASNRARALAGGSIANLAHVITIPFQYLDSPSSTSQLTYSLQFRHDGGSSKNLFLNRSQEDTDNVYQTRVISVITAMEVAG